jgi:hypothetical protein
MTLLVRQRELRVPARVLVRQRELWARVQQLVVQVLVLVLVLVLARQPALQQEQVRIPHHPQLQSRYPPQLCHLLAHESLSTLLQ